MTDDDRLRAELEALERVAPTYPVPTVSHARLTTWLRMSLVGLTTAGAVLLTSLLLGPLAPRETGQSTPSAHPSDDSSTTAQTRVDDFVLTISSRRSVWTTSDDIQVVAELSYVGREDGVSIGQGIPPILFDLMAASGEGPRLVGLQAQPCVQYPLAPDRPLVEPFRKGIPFTGEGEPVNAAVPFDAAFRDDPALHLPAGDWEFVAYTQFGPSGECGDEYQLRVSIVLQVIDGPTSATPAASESATPDESPAPTLEPSTGGAVVRLLNSWATCCYIEGALIFGSLDGPTSMPPTELNRTDDLEVVPGDYELAFFHRSCSANCDFHLDDPTGHCSAAFTVRAGDRRLVSITWYVGDEPCQVTVLPLPSTPIDPPVIAGEWKVEDEACASLEDVYGNRWSIEWPAGYRVGRTDRWQVVLFGPEGEAVAGGDAVIGVRGSPSAGPGCGTGRPYEATEIVSVEPGQFGDYLVPVAVHDPPVVGTTPQPCPAALLSGSLVADSRSGAGLRDSDDNRWSVTWPTGYFARQGRDGIELFNGRGEIVGTDGEVMTVGGGERPDGLWSTCGG